MVLPFEENNILNNFFQEMSRSELHLNDDLTLDERSNYLLLGELLEDETVIERKVDID
jgi:hypothetical protein